MEIKLFNLKLVNKRWVFPSLLLSIFLLLPIFALLLAFLDGGYSETFNYLIDTVLFDYSINTIYLVFITCTSSLIFGVFPAWVISNYSFFGRKFFDVVLYLPLAIPSYIMAFTYIEILSYTGPIQSFFRKYTPFPKDLLNYDFMQIEVLGFIMGLALFPYVYTSSRISFSLIGSSYINVSKNLGLSSFQLFYKIVLPLSRPAIFSGLFLVIMETLNEYGAVKYFGVNTFTSGIFRSWFSLGDVNGAIQLAIFLLIFVCLLFYLDKILVKNSKFYYSKNEDILKEGMNKSKKTTLFFLICSIPFILGFLVPLFFILGNVIFTLSETDFSKVFTLTLNSVFTSSASAIIIILIALFLLFVERISNKKLFFLGTVTSLGYALPGAVIGLGIIHLFSYYSLVGTFFVLFYAYIIRFLAVAKSPIKSSIEKQPHSFDETGKNLGLGPFKLLQYIHFPINKYALFAAFILVFVDVMKELPITLILRPFNFDTLATQTYEFAVEEMIPTSSIYSFLIILFSATMLLILKKMIDKQVYVSRG